MLDLAPIRRIIEVLDSVRIVKSQGVGNKQRGALQMHLYITPVCQSGPIIWRGIKGERRQEVGIG